MAYEKRASELPFQGGDVCAQRLLRDAQPFRRFAEATFRGHGGEVFDAEKVHGDTSVFVACLWRVPGVNQYHSIKPVIDISLVCISPVILSHGSCE